MKKRLLFLAFASVFGLIVGCANSVIEAEIGEAIPVNFAKAPAGSVVVTVAMTNYLNEYINFSNTPTVNNAKLTITPKTNGVFNPLYYSAPVGTGVSFTKGAGFGVVSFYAVPGSQIAISGTVNGYITATKTYTVSGVEGQVCPVVMKKTTDKVLAAKDLRDISLSINHSMPGLVIKCFNSLGAIVTENIPAVNSTMLIKAPKGVFTIEGYYRGALVLQKKGLNGNVTLESQATPREFFVDVDQGLKRDVSKTATDITVADAIVEAYTLNGRFVDVQRTKDSSLYMMTPSGFQMFKRARAKFILPYDLAVDPSSVGCILRITSTDPTVTDPVNKSLDLKNFSYTRTNMFSVVPADEAFDVARFGSNPYSYASTALNTNYNVYPNVVYLRYPMTFKQITGGN